MICQRDVGRPPIEDDGEGMIEEGGKGKLSRKLWYVGKEVEARQFGRK